MEEREPSRAGGAGHVGRVLDGRMAPALLRRVFLFGVLRVVDDEIDVAHELDVPLVAGMLVPAGRRVPERLVIRGVGDGGTAARDSIRDGRRRVIQVLRLDQHVADAEEALVELGEVDARAQIAELHREVRVLHLPGHRLFQPALKAERRVDVQLGARHERRDEEGKALDVIPVGVPDQEMQARRERDLREVEAQAAGARAAVENDQCAVTAADFHARGVAAVARRLLPGRGDGPSSAPEPYVHALLVRVRHTDGNWGVILALIETARTD